MKKSGELPSRSVSMTIRRPLLAFCAWRCRANHSAALFWYSAAETATTRESRLEYRRHATYLRLEAKRWEQRVRTWTAWPASARDAGAAERVNG